MRDSALKLAKHDFLTGNKTGRRRAHARQRFETIFVSAPTTRSRSVGEELMRDSALKPSAAPCERVRARPSEKSSCATAL